MQLYLFRCRYCKYILWASGWSVRKTIIFGNITYLIKAIREGGGLRPKYQICLILASVKLNIKNLIYILLFIRGHSLTDCVFPCKVLFTRIALNPCDVIIKLLKWKICAFNYFDLILYSKRTTQILVHCPYPCYDTDFWVASLKLVCLPPPSPSNNLLWFGQICIIHIWHIQCFAILI